MGGNPFPHVLNLVHSFSASDLLTCTILTKYMLMNGSFESADNTREDEDGDENENKIKKNKNVNNDG